MADEAVRLSPRWPKAHFRRGLALRALDSLPAAATAFQRSLDLDPTLADVRRPSLLSRVVGGGAPALPRPPR
jgi:predicted TPR repeat methyltransferase